MGNSFPIDKCIKAGTNAIIQFVHLTLVITSGEDGCIKDLLIRFGELGSIGIGKVKNNLLDQIYTYDLREFYETIFFNETKNRWGGITRTRTDVAHHQVENEGNLVVMEQKRKKGVEKPCAITVAHYYAFSKQSYIGKKKYEVGLSIVVDIKALNNDFDVSWKGYSEHPSWALFEMFRQVTRSWTWKWTACPHCAAQTRMQQFESETENDEVERNYLQ